MSGLWTLGLVVSILAADGRHLAAGGSGLPTGTLLVSEGDCLAVRLYTRSAYTHVGIVVVRDERSFVYDSANGVGVRCQPLERFVQSQASSRLHVLQPDQPLTGEQCRRLREYLDGQLGRPYAVTHYLNGGEAEGLHCSEYVTEGLVACGLAAAHRPSRVSPGSLMQGMVESRLYDPPSRFDGDVIRSATDARVDGDGTLGSVGRELRGNEMLGRDARVHQSWCSRSWSSTCDCSRQCYNKLRGWFCCR